MEQASKIIKVNVVTEMGSWILRRIARESIKHPLITGRISNKVSSKYDVNYFVNYALYEPINTKTAAYFTHIDSNRNTKKLWEEAEKGVDLGIFMAERYTPNTKLAIPIPVPGFDYHINQSYRIGLVGRQYSDGRKGEDEILEIAKGLVDYKITWATMGTWPIISEIKSLSRNFTIEENQWISDNDSINFYKNIDVLLSFSKYEGGPVPIWEAVKVGTPVLTRDVGNIEYWRDCVDIVKSVPEAVKLLKSNLRTYTKRKILCSLDWQHFRYKHYEAFRLLCQK